MKIVPSAEEFMDCNSMLLNRAECFENTSVWLVSLLYDNKLWFGQAFENSFDIVSCQVKIQGPYFLPCTFRLSINSDKVQVFP